MRRTTLPARFLLVTLLGLLLGFVSQAYGEPTWSFVTIPDLPGDAYVFRSWTDQPGNFYVWGNRDTPTRDAYLYHWDGASWTRIMHLPDHDAGLWAGYVFGTGPADVFASAVDTVSSDPVMFHYDGLGWTQQTLPAQVIGAGCNHVLGIVGEPGNVYASIGCPTQQHRLRHDGNSWQLVQSDAASSWPGYIGQDEIYVVGCWGHMLWDGATWAWYQGFDFCDVWDVWGMRDGGGQLHLYASGANNFNNGIRVWQFVEDSPGSMTGSWGSKFGTVLSDPPGTGYAQAGNSYGLWGSGPDDIYVTGWRDDADLSTRGRVYHFDGASWELITEFGDIPVAYSVSGSGPNDVWVSLSDGRLLHRSEPLQVPLVSAPGLAALVLLLLGGLLVVGLRRRTG